jgi:hypothetical protein
VWICCRNKWHWAENGVGAWLEGQGRGGGTGAPTTDRSFAGAGGGGEKEREESRDCGWAKVRRPNRAPQVRQLFVRRG